MDPLKPLWLSQTKILYDETQQEQRTYSCPLLDLFRLNVCLPASSIFDYGPSENEKKRLFLGKKFTKDDQFDLARAKQTLCLVRNFRFLSFALESLYLHYDYWQGTSTSASILSTQLKLNQLHANFFALLDAVGEFTIADLRDVSAFREVHSNSMESMVEMPRFKLTSPAITNAQRLADDLYPYFRRDLQAIENGTKEGFITILRTHIGHQFFYNSPEQPKILKALPGVARLQLALREAKAQAASEKVLKPLGVQLEDSANPSLNKIYELKNRDRQIVAYLKDSKAFGAKSLEKLAWDLGCIFGVDTSFNPTTTTAIHYYQNGFGTKYHLGWRHHNYSSKYFQGTGQQIPGQLPSGKKEEQIPAQLPAGEKKEYIPSHIALSPPNFLTLASFDCLDRGIPGSFQPALRGCELAYYVANPINLVTLKTNKDQLILATLVTILYGMMDAHAKNIFVQDKKDEEEWKIEEGALIFFDNPRIFPNGDVILAEDFLLTSYRSGLLELTDSYTPFDERERQLIREQIESFERKIPLMEEFLQRKAYKRTSSASHEEKKSSTTRQLERKTLEEILPAHWFNTKKVVQNTKDRLKRTREACEKAVCLRDLVFASNPDFKWVAALHIAAFNPTENKENDLLKIQKTSLPNVGGCPIQQVLRECEKKGIDSMALKKACEDPELSFDMLLDNLFNRKMTVQRVKPLLDDSDSGSIDEDDLSFSTATFEPGKRFYFVDLERAKSLARWALDAFFENNGKQEEFLQDLEFVRFINKQAEALRHQVLEKRKKEIAESAKASMGEKKGIGGPVEISKEPKKEIERSVEGEGSKKEKEKTKKAPEPSKGEILVEFFKVNQEQAQLLYAKILQKQVEKLAKPSTEQALKELIEKAVPDFKDRDISSLTVSPERLAVLSKMTLLQFRNLGFPIVEIEDSKKESLDKHKSEDYIDKLRGFQLQLATEFLEKNTSKYVILPPGNYYYDTKFTLFYKEEEKGILFVEIDVISSPGVVNLDNYMIPSLTLDEFKKFCDDLPVSLRYRQKDETSIPTQCWVVELNPVDPKGVPLPKKYTSIVLVGDE